MSIRRTRGEWLLRAGAVFFGLVLSFVLAEGVLRLPGLPFPMELRNQLFGCFGTQSTYRRAWYEEPRLALPLLRPNFSTTCFQRGRRWHHAGDRWGFRNPASWDRVEVALLGDSFVYGQGVEEDQTIARRLRDELGVRVANLGVVATSPVHYIAYLRNFALRLEPKVVVVLFFANDFDDMLVVRSADELRAYAEGGPAPELGVHDRESLLAAAPDPTRWTFERLMESSASYRAVKFYLSRSARMSVGLDVPAEVPALPVIRAYLDKAIRVMAESTRERGAELVLGFIPTAARRMHGRNQVATAMLPELAAANAVPFLDLTPVLMAPSGDPLPGTRLSGDLHLTSEGNARVATTLASFFAARGLAFRR